MSLLVCVCWFFVLFLLPSILDSDDVMFMNVQKEIEFFLSHKLNWCVCVYLINLPCFICKQQKKNEIQPRAEFRFFYCCCYSGKKTREKEFILSEKFHQLFFHCLIHPHHHHHHLKFLLKCRYFDPRITFISLFYYFFFHHRFDPFAIRLIYSE